TWASVIWTLSLHDALPIFVGGNDLGIGLVVTLAFHQAHQLLGEVDVGAFQRAGCQTAVLADAGRTQHGRAGGGGFGPGGAADVRSEEHTSELQSRENLVCR